MSDIQMIETVTFRLKDGTDPAVLRARAEDLEAYFAACTGYLGRVLYQQADGQWIDQISWADEASMRACDAGFRAHPAAAPYMALVADGSVHMHHTAALLSRAA
nr:hypothetical protein [uncultured Celeribacter sp.]